MTVGRHICLMPTCGARQNAGLSPKYVCRFLSNHFDTLMLNFTHLLIVHSFTCIKWPSDIWYADVGHRPAVVMLRIFGETTFWCCTFRNLVVAYMYVLAISDIPELIEKECRAVAGKARCAVVTCKLRCVQFSAQQNVLLFISHLYRRPCRVTDHAASLPPTSRTRLISFSSSCFCSHLKTEVFSEAYDTSP